MKACAYCGKENEDAATVCSECGTDRFRTGSSAPQPPPLPSPAPTEPSEWRLRDLLANPAQLFRALVLVSIATYLLSVFVTFLEAHVLIFPSSSLLSHDGQGALVRIPSGVYWLMVLLQVAVAVGLYHFSASARNVFVLLLAGFGVLGLFFGVRVGSSLVNFLAFVEALANGAILVLAYATPLKEKFV